MPRYQLKGTWPTTFPELYKWWDEHMNSEPTDIEGGTVDRRGRKKKLEGVAVMRKDYLVENSDHWQDELMVVTSYPNSAMITHAIARITWNESMAERYEKIGSKHTFLTLTSP